MKNSRDLCYMDKEEFIWFKSTNKGPKLCWIETTQDVETYQTRWEYLISALKYLIENRAAIDYKYGPMVGVGTNIKNQLPKWTDWEVSITVVHTKNIFQTH